MVPFLNAILGTMLPMLGMARQDNMKWVFSSGKNPPTPNLSLFYNVLMGNKATASGYAKSRPLYFSYFVSCSSFSLLLFPCPPPRLAALCHFSDSILEYLANLDKAPDPTVRKDTFSGEIYAAFDILFNNWLQSREHKLRLTVGEAVGSMCHLMASDKLEEQIPRIIPAIVSLYKKNTEHYVINRTVMYVLQKLENSNERSRMGSLAVLRHLINSSCEINAATRNHQFHFSTVVMYSFTFFFIAVCMCVAASTMESKKLLILASIRQPMADHSNKVTFIMMQRKIYFGLWEILYFFSHG
ncbi:hypothetical protein XENOCAPTIV_027733 [Xenoophorus captivus]|uniref:MROH2B-like N-terminal HEAT-repeats domain-containing protein n=1 Tax=Xenoophorus captivus TaxID=1517983 RepID=A0ABV0RY26_9TELE